jgi:NADH-quinone oxidoreductase subunit K
MIAFEIQLLIAGILFTLGLVGLLVRRNLLFMLMSLEIMMNAAAFAFISAGARWMQPDGQVMFIFILTVAAAEVSVALALVMLMYKHFKSVDTSKLVN